MTAIVNKISFSLLFRGHVRLKPGKFPLHNRDAWLLLVCEVSPASYQPMGDSKSRVTWVERAKREE